jgi:hypothetical protein|tara:strand:+ start:1009 stop:1224 length:216 start_codon:yes stop_codon:yes gene_type:complete
MKKIQMLVVLLLTGMFMVSCGGVNACDCVDNAKQMGTADYDADLQKDCVDHVEGLEGEDKTEWQKEMLDCM